MTKEPSYSSNDLVIMLKGMDEDELMVPVQMDSFYLGLLGQRNVPIVSGRVSESDAEPFMEWYEANRPKLNGNGNSNSIEDVLPAAEVEVGSGLGEAAVVPPVTHPDSLNPHPASLVSPVKEGLTHDKIVTKMRSYDTENGFRSREESRFYERRVSMYRKKEGVKPSSGVYPSEFVDKLMLWYGERRGLWEEGKRAPSTRRAQPGDGSPRVHLSIEPVEDKDIDEIREYTPRQIYDLMAREDRAYGVDPKLITDERHGSIFEMGKTEVGKFISDSNGEIFSTPRAVVNLIKWYNAYLRLENKMDGSKHISPRDLAASLRARNAGGSSLEKKLTRDGEASLDEEEKDEVTESGTLDIGITSETICADPEMIFQEIKKLPIEIDPAKEGAALVEKYLHHCGRADTYNLSLVLDKVGIGKYVTAMVRGSTKMPLVDFLWLWYNRVSDTFDLTMGGAYSRVERRFEKHNFPVTITKIRDLLLQSQPIISANVKIAQKSVRGGRSYSSKEGEKRYFSGVIQLQMNPEAKSSQIRFSKKSLDDCLDAHFQPLLSRQRTREGARDLFLDYCRVFTSQDIPLEVVEKALTCSAEDPDQKPEEQRGFILDVLELNAGMAVLKEGLCEDLANRPDGDRLRKLFRFYDGGELDTSNFKQQPLELGLRDEPDSAERETTAYVDDRK